MFGKSNALNDILCFQRRFKCGPYSNSAIKLPIQPGEFIKKHAHKFPILEAGHLHEKMLQPQTTSLGSAYTHVTAIRACQNMCIINHSLSHMHGCAYWCHETSLTLSIDNWLNAICHCQFHFPQSDLHFYHPLSCISLNRVCPFITNYLTSSIHFSPTLKENLYHLLMPMDCWYVQRSAAILRSPPWSAHTSTQKRTMRKQMLAISVYCPFILHSRHCKHSIDCVKA